MTAYDLFLRRNWLLLLLRICAWAEQPPPRPRWSSYTAVTRTGDGRAT